MFPRTVRFAGLALLAACPTAFAQEWTEASVLALFDQQTPLRRDAQSATAAIVESIRGKTLWPNPIAAYSRETVGFTEFIQLEQQLPISKRLAKSEAEVALAYGSKDRDRAARLVEAGAARTLPIVY